MQKSEVISHIYLLT